MSLGESLGAAAGTLREGRLQAAREALDGLREVAADSGDFWALEAELAIREGRLEVAGRAVDQALMLQPERPERHIQRARCCILAGNVEEALISAEAALNYPLERLDHLLVLGGVLVRCARHEQALALYQQASQRVPHSADAWRGLASVYRILGQLERAECAAYEAIRLDPQDYETIGLRSTLRTWGESDNHVAALEALAARTITNWRGAVQVQYALAKEYEDLGRWQESFAALERGARLKRRHTQYDHTDDLKIFPSIKQAFTREALAKLGERGHSAHDPIFVLGMPRTGSTLIERIITSHSNVQNLGELSSFSIEMVRLVKEQNGGAPVDRLDLAQHSLALPMDELGKSYLASVASARDGSPRFVDKLPLNCLNVGLLHAALPRAKIVHVVRDPMDACYAIYKYLFRNGYPFSYDLLELAAYYAEYVSLMAHWHQVLPAGRIYDVHYEAVVNDLPGQAQQLLGYLDLSWEPECVEFHVNRQPSTTGSAAQVRRPVYVSSIGKWRRYERELEPLRQTLATAGVLS